MNLPILNPCSDCGVCCMHMASPPYDHEEREWLQEEWPEVLADLLSVESGRDLALKAHAIDYMPCGFFDMVTRKCRHHNHKPDICRRFEVGDTDCLFARKEAGLPPVDYVPNQLDSRPRREKTHQAQEISRS